MDYQNECAGSFAVLLLIHCITETMNVDTIPPVQEQGYSAAKSLLVVSIQFQQSSCRNAMMQRQHRDIKDKFPVEECSKHHREKDELVETPFRDQAVKT